MTATAAQPWPVDGLRGSNPGMSRLSTPEGRRFIWAAAAAGILSSAFIAWTWLGLGGDQVTTAVDDLGEAAAALVAALSCGYASRRSTGRQRLAWGLLGLSALSWAIGEIVWSVYEVGLGQNVPFPSAADAGFLLAIPLAVAGVLAFPSAPGRLTTRSQALVDGAIVALSLVWISWALGLGKVYQATSDQPVAQLIGAAYPVSDVVIIAVLLLVMRRATTHQRGSMLLLLCGLAANSVADSAFAYLTTSGLYAAGSVLDAGWVVGYLLIALAPLWPVPLTGAVAEEGPVDVWQMSVPWISLFGAALIAMGLAATGRGMDNFLTALAGGLGMLLVVSMILLHRDSAALLKARDRSQAELVERTEMINQVISHAPLGVARVGTDLRILDANPRLGFQLHAPAKIMVGSRVSDYVAPDEFDRLTEKLKPLSDGAVETVEGDSPVHRADGTDVWLHWSVTSVRATGGRIDYFLAMFEDITSKHEADEAAMANLAGLERLNQLKSEFVSMVSHEFRTALVGIQGFSEVLRDESMAMSEVKGMAADINKDAQRLNRMIGEMLDLDRMEAGKIRLTPRPLDVNALVLDAIERARVSTEKHTIVADLDRALPIVSGDQDRLAQVVSNLLSNAIKYSPDGGEIRVATRATAEQVTVSVVDHGVGIPAEFIDRLFGRYERFESNRTSKVVGTGLGLAISRQIIELHGGKIWVESAAGAGSSFLFSLPVQAASRDLTAG